VVSEVCVETAAGPVSAVITTRSVDRMKLQVGDAVVAVVKATEVGLEKA
jgi:molybdopterin-binding protein